MSNSVSMKMFDRKVFSECGYSDDQMILFVFKDGSIMTCMVSDYNDVRDNLEEPIMYCAIYLCFEDTVDGYYGVINYGDCYGAVVVVDGICTKLGTYSTSREAAFISDLYIIEHGIGQRLNLDHGELQ